MTGYRSGFAAGDDAIVGAMRAFRPTVGTAPQEFVQRASIVAWGDEAHVEEARALYRAKREALLPVLERKGLRVAASRAGMYLWVEVEGGSEPFAERLLEHGIVVSPGSFFGPSGEGYVRFALVPEHRRLPPRGGSAGGGAVTPERVEEVIAALDRGETRVAEPVDGEWRVTRRRRRRSSSTSGCARSSRRSSGLFEYRDKIPLKRGYEELGVRVVPPAVARYGSYLVAAASC